MYEATLIGFPICFLTEERVSSLILEGKDPLEVLSYKFPDIPQDVIQKIISIDPTKKKSYSQWLCKQWNGEQDTILKNLQNGRIEKLFQYAKNHPEMQIKDVPSVEEGIKMYLGQNENKDTVLDKSEDETTYIKNCHEDVPSYLANDFDIVYNEDNWLIAVPNTYEAECKLGEGMKWCTANGFGSGGRGYYDRYLSEGGKYYVNFDLTKPEKGPVNGQDYPYSRYQFHFESKQFMNSHDNSVSFEEIGLPQTAYDFYEKEGYNMEEYGLSEEEKMERYDNDRWGDAIRVTEELYLNQEYNDDYEYTEPDENTDFYLFDEDDDRDPIDWTTFPNSDDVIQWKNSNETAIVLKQKSEGDYSFVYYNQKSSSWRKWEMEDIGFFKIEDDIFIGTNQNAGESYAIAYIKDMYCYTQVNKADYEDMFINKSISNDNLYVELIQESGYHTLVEFGEKSKLIISADLPINGKYFALNQNGYIEGEFNKYAIGNVEPEDDASNFQIEKEIDKHTLLVYKKAHDNGADVLYNLFDKVNRRFIIPFDFEMFLREDQYDYIIRENSKQYIFSKQGVQIGKKYDQTGWLISPKYLAGINSNFADIIDVENQKVVETVQYIDVHFGRTQNGTIAVNPLNYTDGLKLYNVPSEQYVLSEYNSFARIKDKWNISTITQYATAYKDDDSTRTLINLDTLKPVLNGIYSIGNATYNSHLFQIIFADKTQNIFNPKTEKLVLPQNVREIEMKDEIDYVNVVPYTNDGTHLCFWNLNTNQNVISQSGIDTTYMKEYFLSSNYHSIFVTTKNGITFEFFVDDNHIEFRTQGSYSNQPIENARNNPEVLQTLSQLTGIDYTSELKEDVKRQFNNLLKRIL